MYNQDNTERPTIDLNQVESRYRGMPNWPDRPYRQERPLGVTLIAIWQFIGAGLAALIVLLAFGASRENSALGLYACIYAIIIPINIAIGIGFWTLRSWARTIFLVFAVLSLVLSVFSNSLSGGSVLSIVLNVAAVIYLFQPDVRTLFESLPYRYDS